MRGLSRIEIIAVPAIISALAVLLLPGFAAHRRRLGESQCLSNLRQIGAATRLYMNDYDDYFPIAWDSINPSWNVTVGPYIKGVKRTAAIDFYTYPVFHCPLDTNGPAQVSYATNALVSGAGTTPVDPPENLAGIISPAKVVWAGETNKRWSRDQGFYDTFTDWIRPLNDMGYPKTDDRAVRFYRQWLKERDWTDLQDSALDCPDGLYQCKYPSYRHRRTGTKTGYCNFVFIDGHARACGWGQLNVENFFPAPTQRQLDKYNR